MFAWTLVFRENTYTKDHVEIMSDMYHETLVDAEVTYRQFTHAVLQANKVCKFFPKIADIMDQVHGYRSNPPSPKQTDRIAYDPMSVKTAEQVELDEKRLAVYQMAVSKQITMEEATAACEAINKKYQGTKCHS